MDDTIRGPDILIRNGEISAVDRSIRPNRNFLPSESLDVLLTAKVFKNEFFSRDDVSFKYSLQQCAL